MKVEILGYNVKENKLNCAITDDNGNWLQIVSADVPEHVNCEINHDVVYKMINN